MGASTLNEQRPQFPVLDIENDNDLTPEFAMSAWNGDDGDRSEVNLLVHVTNFPRQRHASHALLYGLAILTLDQQGTIASTIEQLLEKGPISEGEAVARIDFLIQRDFNEQAI